MRSGRSTHGEGWNWRELHAVALNEARHVLSRSEDAEDAAQEAVIRAYRAKSRCLTPDAPHAWVRVIARREAFRVHARAPRPMAELDESVDVGGPDTSEEVLERIGADQMLAELGSDDRRLLVRRYVLEQTSSEIARELGMPAATVRVNLHRLTKRVRAVELARVA